MADVFSVIDEDRRGTALAADRVGHRSGVRHRDHTDDDLWCIRRIDVADAGSDVFLLRLEVNRRGFRNTTASKRSNGRPACQKSRVVRSGSSTRLAAAGGPTVPPEILVASERDRSPWRRTSSCDVRIIAFHRDERLAGPPADRSSVIGTRRCERCETSGDAMASAGERSKRDVIDRNGAVGSRTCRQVGRAAIHSRPTATRTP